MAQYRTLAPVIYIDSVGVVTHVTKAGVVIELTTEQAAALEGLVMYVGAPVVTSNQMELYGYPSAAAFPDPGSTSALYFDRGAGRLYHWTGTQYSVVT